MKFKYTVLIGAPKLNTTTPYIVDNEIEADSYDVGQAGELVFYRRIGNTNSRILTVNANAWTWVTSGRTKTPTAGVEPEN